MEGNTVTFQRTYDNYQGYVLQQTDVLHKSIIL